MHIRFCCQQQRIVLHNVLWLEVSATDNALVMIAMRWLWMINIITNRRSIRNRTTKNDIKANVNSATSQEKNNNLVRVYIIFILCYTVPEPAHDHLFINNSDKYARCSSIFRNALCSYSRNGVRKSCINQGERRRCASYCERQPNI